MAVTPSSITVTPQVEMTAATATFLNLAGVGENPPLAGNDTLSLIAATGGVDGQYFGTQITASGFQITEIAVTLESHVDLDRVQNVRLCVQVVNGLSGAQLIPDPVTSDRTHLDVPLYAEYDANGNRTGVWRSRPLVPAPPACTVTLFPFNLIGCPGTVVPLNGDPANPHRINLLTKADYVDSGRRTTLCGHADCTFNLA